MHKLKKYPNRRIYHTGLSSYITLEDIRAMVLAREEFQVVDSKTGKDLTRAVLLQIIAEMEAEGHESLLTNRLLEELIRFYGDSMVGMLSPFVEKQIVGLLKQQDSLRRQLRKLSPAGSRGSGQSLAGLVPVPAKLRDQFTQQYQQLLKSFGPGKKESAADEEDESDRQEPEKGKKE
jgi:polyhydroxyalkanoate synthesis repressor PhaR